MSLKNEINSAIAAHSLWKAKLQKALDTGVFDTPPDIIALDNQCDFGKWLHGEALPPTVRNSEEYKRVKDYHAKFHSVAAKVVELSLAGNKIEAAKLMALNGEYTTITTKLVMELQSWADKVA